MHSLRTCAFIIVCLRAAFSPAGVTAQTHDQPPPNVKLGSTHERVIRSEILARDFTLSVSLPAGYDLTGKRYPTVYLTDADSGFGLAHVASLSLQLDEEIPEIIVVGVGYGLDLPRDTSKWMSRRAQEFTPTPVKVYPGSGEAAQFSRFLREELIPFIENTYRVDATDRTLVGGSFGGLFAVYDMLQSTRAFHHYVARSPSLFWDDRVLFKLEADYAGQHRDLPVTLVTSVGAVETNRLRSAWQDFVKVLEGRQYRGFRLVLAEVPSARHATAIGVALYSGLKAALGHIDSRELDRYVGRYELVGGAVFSIGRDGNDLAADWLGQRDLALLVRSRRKVSLAAGQGEPGSDVRALEWFEFHGDDRDAINEVVVHANGHTIEGKRVR